MSSPFNAPRQTLRSSRAAIQEASARAVLLAGAESYLKNERRLLLRLLAMAAIAAALLLATVAVMLALSLPGGDGGWSAWLLLFVLLGWFALNSAARVLRRRAAEASRPAGLRIRQAPKAIGSPRPPYDIGF